jgi:hypothetical protein
VNQAPNAGAADGRMADRSMVNAAYAITTVTSRRIEYMHLPSLKFLKTFQVAAKLQSFKAAAKELFVTPSAVSHQIKTLEEQLGIALFERGVRTLTLTDAGTHYLEHIDEMIAKLVQSIACPQATARSR